MNFHVTEKPTEILEKKDIMTEISRDGHSITEIHCFIACSSRGSRLHSNQNAGVVIICSDFKVHSNARQIDLAPHVTSFYCRSNR
jgi:hypothetical protein